jgi:hypothetical protein
MKFCRYEYQLSEVSTVAVPEHLVATWGKQEIVVLYHPDAPFSIQELYDDVLPALGRQYKDDAAYFLTPIRLNLELVCRKQGLVAVLTFHHPFHRVTLEQMKHLKKLITSLSEKLPCEVIFGSDLL